MARIATDTRDLVLETIPPCSTDGAVSRTSLDRLLSAACGAPIGCGPEATAQYLLDGFSEILPGYELAVRMREEKNAPVILCRPHQLSEHFDNSASRVFLDLTCEQVIDLDENELMHFHCASDDLTLAAPDESLQRTLDRCVMVFRSSLRKSKEFADALGGKRRAEEALVQRDKLASFGELAAGLVHELSNPLTAIVAYTDFLYRKAKQTHAEQEDLDRLGRVSEAAGQIQKLSRQLIAYAKPSNETYGLVEVQNLIDQALSFCEHSINERSIQVLRLDSKRCLPVRGSSNQLIQVLVNLITNACQAIGSDGEIRVDASLSEDEDFVEFVVSDTGHGIEPHLVPKLFDPFFTTRSHDGGVGLGLNIVRHIVSEHRGRISVRSEVGVGTHFTIGVPVDAKLRGTAKKCSDTIPIPRA